MPDKISKIAVYLFMLLLVGLNSTVCGRENSTKIYGEKEIHKDFKVEKGRSLHTDLKTGGSITIKSWDKDEVSVDATLGGKDWEDCIVGFDQNDSSIEINSKYVHDRNHRNSNVKLEINVPGKFDLDLHTMGGEISIDGVEGKITGQTMGGQLELSHLKGYIDLSTMGGNISLSGSNLDGKVSTMGGEVNFEDVTGDVKGSSMGGNVKMKNVKRSDNNSIRDEVDISSMGGQIDVDQAPNGANVSTMGGNIHINSANKFVKARTMGGNVDIEEVNGSVKATTMGGKINVNEICNPNDENRNIELKSLGGDITLIVPAGFSMDVDITLAYTKENDGDYKIISDFDLNRSQSDKWEYKDGSPRKYLYGKASLNGAKNTIKIETINGNVYLKKAD
jgi:DUF4097 and DUF4098 domain-containing protein YvlB